MDITVRDLTVQLGSGDRAVRPLEHFDLDVPSGSLCLLVGPSGCGKTTLLSILAGILTPTSGSVTFGGEAMDQRRSSLLHHRRSRVGIVFQAFNLVPSMTIVENVAVPLLAAGVPSASALDTARTLLSQVGLSDRLAHRPGQLSGGQQQRVAIARALAHDPPVLLADEPTAHLDPLQVDGVLALLRTLAGAGRTVVISTHDDRLRPLADVVIDLGQAGRGDIAAPAIELAAGEVLFEEGTRGHLIYVIEKGQVEVTRREGASTKVLARLGEGEHVGDMGALFQRPRSATVSAVGPATLRSYSSMQFAALVGAERLGGLGIDGPNTPVAPKARRKAGAKNAVAKKAVAKKATPKRAAQAPAAPRKASRSTKRS
jgi:putative ABC transport system ATP-binding protein